MMSPDLDHCSKETLTLLRDALLQIVLHGCAIFPLGSVVNLVRGEPISQSTAAEGSVPVIGGGAKPAYYVDKSNHDGPLVTIAHQGTAGYVNWWDEPIFLAPQCFGLEPKYDFILPRFLYQTVKNLEPRIVGMRYGNTVPAVSWESISRLEIIIPPRSKQKEVLDGLESFESITNDRIGELVRRIEEVRKQREYVQAAIFEALGGGGHG